MAEAKDKKSNFSVMNVLTSMGMGAGTSFVIERANTNIAMFQSKPWLSSLIVGGAAIFGDYMTNGKYPYVFGGIGGGAGVKIEGSMETMFQGYGSVNGAKAKMDELLANIRNFKQQKGLPQQPGKPQFVPQFRNQPNIKFQPGIPQQVQNIAAQALGEDKPGYDSGSTYEMCNY